MSLNGFDLSFIDALTKEEEVIKEEPKIEIQETIKEEVLEVKEETPEIEKIIPIETITGSNVIAPTPEPPKEKRKKVEKEIEKITVDEDAPSMKLLKAELKSAVEESLEPLIHTIENLISRLDNYTPGKIGHDIREFYEEEAQVGNGEREILELSTGETSSIKIDPIDEDKIENKKNIKKVNLEELTTAIENVFEMSNGIQLKDTEILEAVQQHVTGYKTVTAKLNKIREVIEKFVTAGRVKKVRIGVYKYGEK